MKNLRYLLICILLTGFVATDRFVSAQCGCDKINTKFHKQTGLYGVREGGSLLALQLNGLYYYGDAESLNINAATESMAGLASLSYAQMFSRHFAWRVGLNGGLIRGDNENAPKKTFDKKFTTGFFEPSIGVQYYPFDKAGFYLYVGFSFACSFIDYQYKGTSGKTFGILPMIPVELGYNFNLGHNWVLGINVAVHQGLCDLPKASLDGWPLTFDQNNTGAENWADGYFQFGLTIGYRIVK